MEGKLLVPYGIEPPCKLLNNSNSGPCFAFSTQHNIYQQNPRAAWDTGPVRSFEFCPDSKVTNRKSSN